jgi:hypothetical protein
MATVVFHVTSAGNRDSIRRHGLDWRQMLEGPGIAGSMEAEAPCNFLARDLEEAEWFVAMGRRNHETIDVWEVTLPHDLEVHDEPPACGPYFEIDGFLCTTEPIPPERLRLLPESIR